MIQSAKSLPPRDLIDEPVLYSVYKAWRKMDKSEAFRRIPVEEVSLEAASRIVLLTDPRSLGADRFRYLRMHLREVRDAAKLRTLVITSALPREGKSTVAMNLATALSEGGKKYVLLIEADLYNPTIASGLGLATGRPGLAECLEDGI